MTRQSDQPTSTHTRRQRWVSLPRARQQWFAMPRGPVADNVPVWSLHTERAYDCIEDAVADGDRRGIPLRDMLLVHMRPVMAQPIDVHLWEDQFPDDLCDHDHIRDTLQEACDAANAIIEGLVMHYEPGEVAVFTIDVDDDES